jgi:hypothetical protein
MFLKLFSFGSAAAIASVAAFFALQTVGYANSGPNAATDERNDVVDVTNAPVQIDLPAGWARVPASRADGALYALRCEANGCVPGVVATLSCVSAGEPHDGAAGDLVTLATERPAIGPSRQTGTSDASIVEIGGREFHERSSVLTNGRYVLSAATRIGNNVCGLDLMGPRSEGARLDLTIRAMLSRLRFS